MRNENTPWGREGLNRSQWLTKHRGAHNMAIGALSHPDIKDAPPATILRHIRDESVPAPAEIFALALQQSADFVESQGSRDHGWIARLRQAAELAMEEARHRDDDEKDKEEAPEAEQREEPKRQPSRLTRTRRKLEAIAPPPPEVTRADPYKLLRGDTEG